MKNPISRITDRRRPMTFAELKAAAIKRGEKVGPDWGATNGATPATVGFNAPRDKQR
jgi:hypothetical protein